MRTLTFFGELFWNNDGFRSQDCTGPKVHKLHLKSVYFRESTPPPEQEGSIVHMKFHSVTIWLTCFSTKPWGFIHEVMPGLPADHEEKVQALTSRLVLLSPWCGCLSLITCFYGHGCEGFASVQEDKCHLWDDFLPEEEFVADFWCLIFWWGETRSLDDGSGSLSSLLLRNLFSKERSIRIAAWPLISVPFSFNPSYKI